MKLLVYGILRGDGGLIPLPSGVGGAPVVLLGAGGAVPRGFSDRLPGQAEVAPSRSASSRPRAVSSGLSRGGLAAACSETSEEGAAPSVERATAFALVVAALHEQGTVLPLRYGCLLESEGEVAELLRRRRAEFLASLDGVAGCAEMGIRVLLPPNLRSSSLSSSSSSSPPSGQENATGSTTTTTTTTSTTMTGRAYLANRRAYYAGQDGAGEVCEALARDIREAFAGLFVRFRSEVGQVGGGRVLSLDFLVRRGDEGRFRAAFDGLRRSRSERLLLSGPWPPYNFASEGNGAASIDVPGECCSREPASKDAARGVLAASFGRSEGSAERDNGSAVRHAIC